MKIRQVEPIILQGKAKYADPSGAEEAHGVFQCLLIRIETDTGIVGWSDVETQPSVAAAAIQAGESGSGLFEGLAGLLVGRDPFDVEAIWDDLYQGTIYYGRRGVALQAISGIDLALHDIVGKAIGQPVHKLLGGARRTKVRAYASTLFRNTPDAMRAACAGYLARGFTAIKFGWGCFGQDRKLDEALIAAARKEIGPDVTLLVDPGWRIPRSAADAIDTAKMLAGYGVFWMEDFLHPEDYVGYRKVADANTGVRVAAGEQECTAWGFSRLIREGGVQVAQPDLSRCGGFTHARKIAWIARENSADVCPHAWLTDLLTAASLHFNATLPRSLFLEYNVSANPMQHDIIANPIDLNADGTMDVPQAPGLGIEINEEAVGRYRVGR